MLTINNSIFYEENRQLFLDKETGNFFIKLGELGNSVSTFQISQQKTEDDTFANFVLSDKKIKIYEVKRKSNRFIPFLISFFVIQKAIIKNDFVYIYFPGPICKVIALLCIFYQKPYGLYIRGEQGIESKLSQIILKKAKTIFTISPSFTQKMSKYNKDTQTIRPMMGFEETDIVTNRTVDFKETVKMLYVGRLVFDKGLFELLDALEILKERGYNIHLNLVGSGIDFNNLVLCIKQKMLEENVTFFGMVSDKDRLINIYKESDIFVLPTYHEGFPRVLYEAMMMQIPIVTTFVGTIGYLMKDQLNCLELIPKNSESIVNQIEKLINNPDLAQSLANNGLETIIYYLKDKKINHAEQLDQFIKKFYES
ncbi:glycosyl transferase family 1 [Chryseobacterium piperi]|uniref:Glycosyl transferase family 1 n=1 Tax=Chryseobacterium piperi TaxID=558152 RepID=A0A086BKB1_9FLAO|nr:glycosyl transferase family 1 [Chryseobacterium piperi]KFF29375.1 glycosyl transferase family 1 [Chryseobacterium piperi]